LSLSRLLDKIDVLGELPYLVRVFIQTFITAPFCYQWMDQVGKATITIENETPIEIQGLLFNETSFLAEIPGHQI
jgi:p-aminobenzoyl-glutamate transporter AbgT